MDKGLGRYGNHNSDNFVCSVPDVISQCLIIIIIVIVIIIIIIIIIVSNWTFRNIFFVKFQPEYEDFYQENLFEIVVCQKHAAILQQSQCEPGVILASQ